MFGAPLRVVGGSLRVINVYWFTACVWWQLTESLEQLLQERCKIFLDIGDEGIGLLALKGRNVSDVLLKV